jgi:hypothetical protein
MMHIQFERSGGFGGLRLSQSIDTDTLPPAEAKRAEEIVHAADFFALPESAAGPPQHADTFQYKLTIEKGDQRHTVRMAEGAVPETMKPLLDWLKAKRPK